ncbi:unnamed protein product, partial [Polarella glacialis]
MLHMNIDGERGTLLHEEASSSCTDDETPFCPSCGRQVLPNASFCQKCGAKQQSRSQSGKKRSSGCGSCCSARCLCCCCWASCAVILIALVLVFFVAETAADGLIKRLAGKVGTAVVGENVTLGSVQRDGC